MLLGMANQEEVPNEEQRAHKARKRRNREDRVEGLAFKALEAGVALIKQVYSTIEDTLGKVENVELKTEALEEQVANLEEVEGELVTDVTETAEAVVDLATELNELEAGQPITQEKLDSLTARVQTANTGLTSLGEKLTKAAAEGKAAGGSGGGGGTGGEEPAADQKPTQAVYVHTDGSDISDEWSKSGFTTTDDPPVTLYYFSGDTNAGDTNGSNAEGWSLYTGDTKPEEVAQA